MGVPDAYIEGDPSKTWSGIGVARNSLNGIPLDSTHFEVMKKGAPGFLPIGGPTHDQWVDHDCENQPDP